jgi:hypothetical protein
MKGAYLFSQMQTTQYFGPFSMVKTSIPIFPGHQ